MPEQKLYEDIGEHIKEIRISLDMTQHQMSKVLGVTSNYLAMLERGERKPSLSVLAMIAHMADISIDELLYGLAPDEETNLDLFMSLSKKFKPKEVADALHFAKTYLEIAKQ